MAERFQGVVRFHTGIATFIAVVVLLLAGSIIYVARSELVTAGRATAEQRFGDLAGGIQKETETLLSAAGEAATLVAMAINPHVTLITPPGSVTEAGGVMDPLITAVRGAPARYSVYLGYEDGRFVQALAVRGNQRIAEAIKAPPGTDLALRVIDDGAGSDGVRQQRWAFFDAAGKVLARRHDGAAEYDPRTRPWFSQSLAARDGRGQPRPSATAPYVFQSSGQLGVTVAAALPTGRGVVGFDLQLGDIQAFLARHPVSAHGGTVLFTADAKVMAATGPAVEGAGAASIPPLTAATATGVPIVARLAVSQGFRLDSDGMLILTRRMAVLDLPMTIAMAAPLNDFTGALRATEQRVLLLSGGLLLIALPLVFWVSINASRQLRRLAQDSGRIQAFDFTGDIRGVSLFSEVMQLTTAFVFMKANLVEKIDQLKKARRKLETLVDSGIMVAEETDRDALFRAILDNGRELCNCDAATLFLRTEQDTLAFALRTKGDDLPTFQLPLFDGKGEPIRNYVCTYVVHAGHTVVLDDVYASTDFDVSGTRAFDAQTGYRTVSMLAVPLRPRNGEVIGVLQFINCLDDVTGEPIPFPSELIGFVEALAAQAAIALDNRRLIEAQEALMDGFVQVIAGAIDAKSAYTGGHCARVPALGKLLAEAASATEDGPFKDFRLQGEEWREFEVAAWLHDCGKVTTPEYIVDKASKLETIYNRIHEVRMRFEVLWRDTLIRGYQRRAAGEDEQAVNAWLEAELMALQDDFAFVAACNEGGEFMADDKVARLRVIGARTWERFFDDRLGLSEPEKMQLAATEPEAQPLPALEPLLADKPRHLYARPQAERLAPYGDNPLGFTMAVPENIANLGEIYNLAVKRGTLTEEDRFRINDHIIQSIRMLASLPYPKHLRRVPEYAGAHHETMTGSGYPRGLRKEQMSVPARILAIADIFEALTAADRPYKKPKTLSESVKIMSFMKKDGHIDPDLFDLFLTSGAYLDYAETFLRPEQIDAVDISQYLSQKAA